MVRALWRPRFAVVGVPVLLALSVLVVSQYQRASRVRWAREEALPEIERLAEGVSLIGAQGLNAWSACELALQAEQAVPGNRMLER